MKKTSKDKIGKNVLIVGLCGFFIGLLFASAAVLSALDSQREQEKLDRMYQKTMDLPAIRNVY